MDALAFIDRLDKLTPRPVYAFAGDEDFLRRLATEALLTKLLDGEDASMAVATLSPAETDFARVRGELETVSFFSNRRIVIIDQADPFVTAHRTALEKYVAAPTGRGVLILHVKTFPKTTKLAKALHAEAIVECKTPSAKELPGWCVEWCKRRHGKQLEPGAAQALVAVIGERPGQLDQELAKLAVAVAEAKAIRLADVERLTARQPAARVFSILEDVCHGRLATGIDTLHRLIADGEDPIGIVSGPLASQLRTLARVGRLCGQGMTLPTALAEAGVNVNWQAARQAAEQQVRHLGPHRLGQLYDWLLETDRALKSTTGLPATLHIERLLVKLARPREDA